MRNGTAVKNRVRTYSTSAKYYDDAYAVKTDLVDLPFYVDLAKNVGGPVLEIGCGTGRVLLPIARQGIEIHGVDNSLSMLGVLKAHLKQEPREVRRNVQLHRGDMRQFRLKRKYPLVIMPFRPLQHMRTVEDQVRALTSAAFHLTKDGIFAFDVFFPKLELIPGGIGEEMLELEWRDSVEPSTLIRRYFREPLIMSYYTYPHLRALFLLAGLEPYEEYGSFARTPLDNSAEQMVFLLQGRKGARS
jgi:SAM-dependent methyltransferase